MSDPAVVCSRVGKFPWLTVWQNVAFGLSLRGIGKAEQRERARLVLSLTSLADTIDKRPHGSPECASASPSPARSPCAPRYC